MLGHFRVAGVLDHLGEGFQRITVEEVGDRAGD